MTGFDAAPRAFAEHTALPASAEPAFDRLADLARRVLDVPTALVTLVDRHRQAFPGAAGLPEPWQTSRETPLSHSFCQHVVAQAQPLVIEDARRDPLVAQNLAIRDLNVVAYAGMPLTDRAGEVVGSLCAIDSRPRTWTEAQLADLRDLAAACSSELQLRQAAETAANESARARAVIESMPAGLLMLDRDWRVTVVNAEAAHIVDMTVDQMVGSVLWELFPDLVGSAWERTSRRVLATGVTEIFEFFYPAPLDRWYENRVQHTGDGLSVCFLDISERQRVRALLEQTAEHDRVMAQTLARALLTDLPAVAGAQLAARYLPAEGTDQVGGDWYDAVVQPSGALAVSVGDVCGHGMKAAAAMGQLRSMLRAFVWDEEGTVARSLSRLDKAAVAQGDIPVTTLISGRIFGLGTSGGARFAWSNAGHLPPLLVLPDGTVTAVEATPQLVLGIAPGSHRSDHVTELPPGSTLVMYTDGLVESRTEEIGTGVDALARSLSAHRHESLEQMLDRTLRDLRSAAQDDDIAVLAVRVDPEPDAGPGSTLFLELAHDVSAPAAARAFVAEAAAGAGADTVDKAVLLTSELVTNAVRHGAPPVRVEVGRDEPGLTVRVFDTGGGLPEAVGFPSVFATGGRGLPIVDAVASRWGVQHTSPRGKLVWFRLEEGV